MAWFNPFRVAKRLRQVGLVGIGQRNADYVLMHNPRKFYPRVDDKLLTKKLALQAGLPVPDLYAVVREEHEIAELHKVLQGRDAFVVKPAHGSGGDGILVITGRRGDRYRRASGNLMPRDEFEHHLSNGLSGLFSLGGQLIAMYASAATISVPMPSRIAVPAPRSSQATDMRSMVIMAMTIERMSVAWDERGAGTAIREGVGTLLVAALAYMAMSWPPLEHLVFVYPETLLVLFAFALLLGRYAGYRLSELVRFRALAREPDPIVAPAAAAADASPPGA